MNDDDKDVLQPAADDVLQPTTSKRRFDQVDDKDNDVSQPIASKRRLNQETTESDKDTVQPVINQVNAASQSTTSKRRVFLLCLPA